MRRIWLISCCETNNLRKYATLGKNNVIELQGLSDPLTELLRADTEQLICHAVEAELQELFAEHSGRQLEGRI